MMRTKMLAIAMGVLAVSAVSAHAKDASPPVRSVTASDPNDAETTLDLKRMKMTTTVTQDGPVKIQEVRITTTTFDAWRCKDLPPYDGFDFTSDNFNLEWRFTDDTGERALGFFNCHPTRGIVFEVTPGEEYHSPEFQSPAEKIGARTVTVTFPFSDLDLDETSAIKIDVVSRSDDPIGTTPHDVDSARTFKLPALR